MAKRRRRIKIRDVEIRGKEVWDSDLEVIEDLKIFVDYRVVGICKRIQEIVEDNEFSILCKGEWRKDGFFVHADFVIPEQTVSLSSVDYDEDLGKYRKEGYNVVIHSHPFGYSSFSSADEEHINTHFPCSILFLQNTFITASICLPVDDGKKVKFKIDKNKIETYIGAMEVEETEVKKRIKMERYSMWDRITRWSKERRTLKELNYYY